MDSSTNELLVSSDIPLAEALEELQTYTPSIPEELIADVLSRNGKVGFFSPGCTPPSSC